MSSRFLAGRSAKGVPTAARDGPEGLPTRVLSFHVLWGRDFQLVKPRVGRAKVGVKHFAHAVRVSLDSSEFEPERQIRRNLKDVGLVRHAPGLQRKAGSGLKLGTCKLGNRRLIFVRPDIHASPLRAGNPALVGNGRFEGSACVNGGTVRQKCESQCRTAIVGERSELWIRICRAVWAESITGIGT